MKGERLPQRDCFCVGIINRRIRLMVFNVNFGWTLVSDGGAMHTPDSPDFYLEVPPFWHLVRE